MFAVPGWSVEAKSLITQQGPTRTPAPKVSEPGAQSAQTSRNRKRKRRTDQAQTKGPAITDENLSEFWSKYIEGKGLGKPNGHVPSGKTERQKKKRRKARGSIEDQVLDKARGNEVLAEAHGKNEKTKDKTHSKPSHKTHDSAAIAQPNGDKPTSENPEGPIQKSESKLDKKARYEQRRIRALEKRSQKSLEQANGTLPPPR
ncbi:25S rRNA (adenine645-N1)-methyltransferase, partial [Sticta canariensis]|nr:25S rRNA (adenine645-N1)-methyltransferase [Sticta canariensis]